MGKTFKECDKAKRDKLNKRRKARQTKRASIRVFTSRKDK